jgi:predicted secreted protein
VNVVRRQVLIGAGLTALLPRRLGAQSRTNRAHQVQLDLPILAEEPATVPTQVWTDYPMEPDHFVKSMQITLENDPVPSKTADPDPHGLVIAK